MAKERKTMSPLEIVQRSKTWHETVLGLDFLDGVENHKQLELLLTYIGEEMSSKGTIKNGADSVRTIMAKLTSADIGLLDKNLRMIILNFTRVQEYFYGTGAQFYKANKMGTQKNALPEAMFLRAILADKLDTLEKVLGLPVYDPKGLEALRDTAPIAESKAVLVEPLPEAAADTGPSAEEAVENIPTAPQPEHAAFQKVAPGGMFLSIEDIKKIQTKLSGYQRSIAELTSSHQADTSALKAEVSQLNAENLELQKTSAELQETCKKQEQALLHANEHLDEKALKYLEQVKQLERDLAETKRQLETEVSEHEKTKESLSAHKAGEAPLVTDEELEGIFTLNNY